MLGQKKDTWQGKGKRTTGSSDAIDRVTAEVSRDTQQEIYDLAGRRMDGWT